MNNGCKVIVVGAGVAGIAASVKLVEAGINVQVLEAENRIGGRIESVYFGESIIDLGAQWCHGEEGNIIYETVKDMNLLAPSFCTYRDNVFYDVVSGRLDKDFTDELCAIYTKYTYDDEALDKDKGSFGTYITFRYMKDAEQLCHGDEHKLMVAKQLLEWLHKLTLCYISAPTWWDISSTGLAKYKELDGDPIMNWKDRGFKMILDVLMKKYPDVSKTVDVESKVLVNKTVSSLSWNEQKNVTVACDDGTEFQADHVILTVSLGVLKSRLNTLFTPQLPEFKRQAIEGLAIGCLNKIFVKFPYRWWPEDCTGFSLVWSNEEKIKISNEFCDGTDLQGSSWLEDVFGFYVIDSEPTTLLGWIVGEKLDHFEKLTDDVIESGCLYLLQKFVGNSYKIPKPTSIVCSKWKSNENFQGTYSYRSLETERIGTSAQQLAEPLYVNGSPKLLFAGEATHPYFFSTVHGAIETGHREAARIIEHHARKNVQHRSHL